MSGNAEGGKKAAETNKKRYGENWYKEIGSKGGSKKGVRKGFAVHRALASIAGAKGGRISKRGKKNAPRGEE